MLCYHKLRKIIRAQKLVKEATILLAQHRQEVIASGYNKGSIRVLRLDDAVWGGLESLRRIKSEIDLSRLIVKERMQLD